MSTFSTDLKIELIGTGEQSGIWGTTTNDNFKNVFEQALVGRVGVVFSDADVTLSATDTVNSQSFRRLYLNCTGTNSAAKNLIVPTINKTYVVENNTTGGYNIVVKTSTGTGVTVPNGKIAAVYVNGTDVIQAFDYLPTLSVNNFTWTGTASGGSITPRVVQIANAISVTINGDTTDFAYQTNTQLAGTLTINAPTGTPVSGQKLIFRLQSTNIQTFSWNAIFQGSTDLSLPTASTGSSKYDYMGFIYNTVNSKWQMVAKNFGF